MTGDELRETRAGLGLSQAALAAKLGVQVTTVSRWERGGIRIPPYLHLALRELAGDTHAT